jgi:hypothetical protein
MKNILLIMAFVLIQGCANYKAIGKFDNANEILVGNVQHNLVVGGSNFEMTAVNSNTKCVGTTTGPQEYENILLCEGQKGSGQATCDDGRTISLKWTATGCTTGYAVGTTEDGHRFTVTFGLSDEEAMKFLNVAADDVANKPSLGNLDAEKKCEDKGLEKNTEEFKICVLENAQD